MDKPNKPKNFICKPRKKICDFLMVRNSGIIVYKTRRFSSVVRKSCRPDYDRKDQKSTTAFRFKYPVQWAMSRQMKEKQSDRTFSCEAEYKGLPTAP